MSTDTAETKLFLVTGTLTTHAYLGDKSDRQVSRLCWAIDEAEADEKVTKHFDRQSVDYGTTYTFDTTEISEAIE